MASQTKHTYQKLRHIPFENMIVINNNTRYGRAHTHSRNLENFRKEHTLRVSGWFVFCFFFLLFFATVAVVCSLAWCSSSKNHAFFIELDSTPYVWNCNHIVNVNHISSCDIVFVFLHDARRHLNGIFVPIINRPNINSPICIVEKKNLTM